VRGELPGFVRTCRTLGDFWDFIKPAYGSYAERRKFLRDCLNPLIEHAENMESAGVQSASATLAKVDAGHIRDAWQKALDRRAADPDGAITAARTLLESVCKHILDDLSAPYNDAADLPALYGLAAKKLNLAPSQHTEEVFKQILGGCHSVVQGLGTLRNKSSDAHGRGRRSVKPAPRHAELAVNLAGAMATFLLTTLHENQAFLAGLA
jgi:hypothetical protein